MKKALTIAGSDSGGGAGIQADIKTFSALSVYGMSVITAITAQNTMGVSAVQAISPGMVQQQLEAVLSDIGAEAVKIGMVGSLGNIKVISDTLLSYHQTNIIIDPVFASTSGYQFLPPEGLTAFIERLFPIARLVTPNLSEAETLTGIAVKSLDDLKRAAVMIQEMGPEMVLVKGGHLEGPAIDLFFDGSEYVYLESERIETNNTHGTGCTLSSAITANLAKGLEPLYAIREAKEYVTMAIKYSLPMGHGKGPTHHFYQFWNN